jgi:hypothetical protein
MADDDKANTPAPLPVGTVIPWAGGWSDPIPPEWLACTGEECPASAADLRALLLAAGCPFGSANGVPYLPDLSGLFVRGVQLLDSANGYDPDWRTRRAPRSPDWQGQQVGVGSVQRQTIVEHTHQHVEFPSGPGPCYSDWSTQDQYMSAPAVSESAGGDSTHPVNIALIHLIKAATDAHEAAPPVGTVVMYSGDGNSLSQ